MNLNIIDKLGVEKQTITIAEGKSYEVNCEAKTVLKAQDIFQKDASVDSLFSVIELLLGKKAKEDIDKMKPTVKQLSTIIIAIMAQVNEVSYEEMEKRFQNIKQ